MSGPETKDEATLRLAVMHDQPDAWRVLAVWRLSLAAGDCKVGDEIHVSRLQNLTGLAKQDAQRWARILFSAQIALSNGEITEESADFVRARMSRGRQEDPLEEGLSE